MKVKSDGILKRIINDLRITPYDKEERGKYISRVVYSALSVWVRVSTLDEDIFEQSLNNSGVSKAHILNRCKPFIDSMIQLYPEIYQWFYPQHDSKNPIGTIRDRLYEGGDLVDVGFNNKLSLPFYEECIVDNKIAIIRGFDFNTAQGMTGLSQFKLLGTESNFDIKKSIDFYGLSNQPAEKIMKEYIKNIKWNSQNELYNEVFNKYLNTSFSNSWNNDYTIKDNDISLYKNNFNDYGFIKNENDSIYTSQIEKYLIDNYEVRRFMYALKHDVGNSAMAQYRYFKEDKLVKLSLYNRLPKKEEDILLMMGWPIKNINDKCNLIFNISVWKFVEAILKNLNIIIQEVN